MSTGFGAQILRCFIGFVLLAACFGKLRTFDRFRANLATSFRVPLRLGGLLAPAVVGAELLLAVLVLGPFPRAGMTAALLLFTAFSALLAWRLWHDGVVRCSCFGEAERSLSGFDLLRNLLIVAATGLFLALPAAAGMPLPAILLAAGLAGILTVLAIDFHDVMHILKGS
ncbi:hypothetical protein NM04_04820 [Massilia aurea]|uniref:Methylamine utilization protein MauE n=1 Tax=Massilia aurea TaxID=373040 RepID=A0A422QPL1_9BURK|nr:MauE/DoxX family redox-associated membrane protein [Massilia aurea]RNF31893.1 hypothetical protein NM04_04820 [Massilia aurea]